MHKSSWSIENNSGALYTETMKKKKKRVLRKGRAAVAALCALAICGGAVWGASALVSRLVHQEPKTADTDGSEGNPDQQTQDQPEEGKTASFTFVGVGDNLLHDPIFLYYMEDTGTRDFLPLYENTLPYTRNADLAYVNFETVCAGDEYGLSGYPNFNGPLEMIDTLAEAGFDWFSVSSNHSMDAGMDGLITEMNYISDNHPDISWTGAARTEEESKRTVVREINGIKVGLAGFTYDLNGYSKPEGADWLIDVYRKSDGTVDYDLMEKRLDALKEVSDVQIVSMHWGDEYVTEVTPEQAEIAKWMNEQGVEVIIGSHPHVIEPVEFITTDDQTTLVYYSLGNFISAQDSNYTMVGGMADFQLNYDFGTGKATFSNVKFIPTVTWISPDLRTYRTNTISEYTDTMAEAQFVTANGEDVTKEWVAQYVRNIVGDPEGIEIAYE